MMFINRVVLMLNVLSTIKIEFVSMKKKTEFDRLGKLSRTTNMPLPRNVL